MASTVARNRTPAPPSPALGPAVAWRLVARIVAASVAFVMLMAAPAAAQDEADTKRARVLLQQGDSFLAKGDKRSDRGQDDRAAGFYEKALASYQEAYQLVPKTTIYFAIANAEARLGRYKEAVEHYQKVIAEVDSPDLVNLAQEAIVGLAEHMGTLVLRVAPEGAELSVDAELRGVAPLEGPVLVTAGEHTITVTADGYTPFEMTLTMEAGSQVEKEIALEKMPVLVKKPKDVDSEGGDNPLDMSSGGKSRQPSKTPLVIGSLATGTFAAASGVTLYLGLADDDSTLTTVGLIAGGVAVLSLGYTTYHYFGVYRPAKARAKKAKAKTKQALAPKLWMTPYVHGQGAGVTLGGLF